MKQNAQIELFSPGIVFFDPTVLSSFIKYNGVTDANVFERFIQSESLGRSAIEQGVVCPLYQISEQDYSIFIECVNGAEYELPVPKFSYSGFPLKVESGVLIVSDLNALFEWGDDFFLNYKENYDSRLPSNDFLEVESGVYNLTINGYVGLRKPLSNCGYGLGLQTVDSLSGVSEDASVDDVSFELGGW
ncbi:MULTISPECIES: hypothetical protein [Pseudomonas]|uniref:hypothetical protein n=1 Tax=Pseudomonas TaxID=286 RepID=UPI0015738690|nr:MULTISPECIES: hypothetical protein [Pseudomonas]MBG6128290.1 hypothetical protein [Pseudomonas sp. M2]NSX19334.1 hypothetical protein [Pseudomonas putida]HDS1744161.1 hypothetical protein [Pseudomonas putida]